MRTMRRLVFILLVSSLILTLAFMRYGGIPTVRASPTVYQGNLVLTGNNVTTITGMFNINGSILVENNATLILRNAIVNFTQTSPHQFSMTLQNPSNGNPRLIIENTTVLSGGYDILILFYANSSCTADHVSASRDNVHFWLNDLSHVFMSNSSVFAVIDYGDLFEGNNCSINQFQLFQSGSANVSSSNIYNLLCWSSGDVIVSDSAIVSVSTEYGSLVQLVNSTYSYYGAYDTSRVTVSWYLSVEVVNSYGIPVGSANVTASYSNATVAESKLTDANGLTRLTLMEKMINATGSYPAGNYTVTAEYFGITGQESVNMTGNQAITISLPLKIVINPDGSITPPTANITTSDEVTYTFTGNNYLTIIVNRSNTIINGMGHTLQVSGGTGFFLQSPVNNVTIKNTTITNSQWGIELYHSYNDTLSGNNITANGRGIYLEPFSNNNILFGNNITANSIGIDLLYSSGNVLSGNNITANGYGMYFEPYSGNNILSGNNVAASYNYGMYFEPYSDSNTLSGNNIIANGFGIDLWSSNNVLCGNNFTANFFGIYVSSSGNRISHNNFLNNAQQAVVSGSTDVWDDGYPSGGNYWSDYTGVDLKYGPSQNVAGGDGIGDANYTIAANNVDHYPLMGPFKTFNAGTWNNTAYSVDIVSNSTITDFNFNPYATLHPTLSFNVTGANGTLGFCRVTIPEGLMWVNAPDEWIIMVNGTLLTQHYINETGGYTYIYFNYTHSTETVKIQSTVAVPEFQPLMLLPPFMIITLLGAFILKRKRNERAR